MKPHLASPAPDGLVRVATSAALLAGLVYLGWRGFDLGHNWWISIPLLVLEIWGIAQLGLLAMMGWRQAGPPSLPTVHGPEARADLVVTATFHSADELERTLVACRSVEGAGRTLVALRPNRPELTAVADRFDVSVIEGEGNHVDLFRHGVAELDSPIAAWFEAGQMPMRDFLTATLGHFTDPAVAVVQARQGMLNKDSLANMRGGRDEDAFRSEVVYPAQGVRGDAAWTGGGSVVRPEALASIGDFPADQAALARAQVKLQAAGWRSRFYGERQLLLDTAPDSLESYLLIRRRRAIESLRVFATAENPLRYHGLSLKQRLDHIAFSSTYLASIRQLGLAGVLFVALLTGAVPFGGSARVWASLWLLQFGLGTIARKLLARGTMGVGDWTRQGWRTLSSDLSAIASVTGLTRRTIRFRGTKDTGVRSLSRMRLVSTLLIAMNGALIARGLTVVFPLMMPRFTTFERVMILLIALLVVWTMIDVLQVAVRRKQRRASYRLNTRLVGYLDGVKVRIVDLTPNGLGARTKPGCDMEVGSTIDFNIGLPDHDQGLEIVKGHGHIRSVTPQDQHDRIGIEFERLDSDSRTRLIDYCAVGHHSLATHDTTIDLTPAKLDANRSSGRGMKMLSGSGVFLGILVLLAGPAALPSLAEVGIPTTTCLASSTGAPLSGGQVSFHYDGVWNEAGATGEDGCLAAALPPQKTTVAMTYQGVRVQVVQDLATTPDVQFTTMSGSVALVSSTGEPLADGDVQLHAGAWRDVGTTNEDGRVSFELLASNRPIAITYQGIRQQLTHDYTTNPEATFNTITGSVTLVSSTGEPLADGDVQLHAGAWRDVGTTNEDGRVSFELLASNRPIAITYQGIRQQLTHDYTTNPEATFNTITGSVTLVSSTGEPLADGDVQLHAGAWRDVGTTNEDGRVSFELLASNRPIAITYQGIRQQLTHDYTTNPEATFNTITGSVTLVSSTGEPLADGDVQLHAGAWRDVGTTNEDGRVSFELLASNRPIAITYQGIRQQLTHDYTTNPEATFNTITGSVTLVSSTGEPLADGDVQLHAGAWRDVGTTNEDGRVSFELLASNRPIAITYQGIRQQLTHDYTTNPEATFNTITGSVTLVSSTGEPLADGDVQLHAGAWRDVGTTNEDGRVSFELLASNRPIAITYQGIRQQLTHDYTTNPEATFNTVPVFADDGVEISKFYQGGWRTFVDGMEMLPSTVHLLRDDGSRAPSVKLQSGVVNYVPSGDTAKPAELAGSRPTTKDAKPAATTDTSEKDNAATDRATAITATEKTTTTTTKKPSTKATDRTTTTKATDRTTTKATDETGTTTKATTVDNTSDTIKADVTVTTADRSTPTLSPGDTGTELESSTTTSLERNSPTSSAATSGSESNVDSGSDAGPDSEVLSGERSGAADGADGSFDETLPGSSGGSTTANATDLDETEEQAEVGAAEEQSSVALDAASQDTGSEDTGSQDLSTSVPATSGPTGQAIDDSGQATESSGDNEPPRIELATGVFLSETEPIVAGLTVTLEPLSADEETGAARYAIKVENPGEEKLAGPVAFRVEVDNLSELRIESADRWRCEQRASAIECISDADVEPRTSYTIIMSTTLSQTGRSLEITAAFVAVLLTGSVVLGISRRRSVAADIEEVSTS